MNMRTSIDWAIKPAMFLLATLATGTAAAQDTYLQADRYIGYGMTYLSPGDREVDYGTGFELSYAYSPSLRNWIEGKLFLGILETGTPAVPDFYQSGIGADYLRSLGTETSGHWFWLAGGGAAQNDATPDKYDGTSYYLNAGLGYRGRLWTRWGVRPRAELRYVHDTFAEGTNDVVLGFKLEMPPNRQMQVDRIVEKVVEVPVEVEKIVETQATCVVAPVAEVAMAPADSDGDGVVDGVDKCPGTLKGARVDGEGCVKEQQKISLPNIEFESGKTVLAGGSKQKLEAVVEFLQNQPEVEVDVFGHTDARGTDANNQALSDGRARAVMDYLVSRGIAASRMTSKGFGETQPISTNETSEGRAQNRRVELLLRTKATG